MLLLAVVSTVVLVLMFRRETPSAGFRWPQGSLENIAGMLEAHIEEARKTEPLEVVVDKGQGSRENGTFLVLCQNKDIYELLETVQNINDRYNHRYGHDWVFLNDEPFDDFFITGVSMHIPKGKLSFGQVPQEHWGYPEWIDREKAAECMADLEARNVWKGGSESYRHMCRFFLGFFYDHPLVAQYQYYWRVEPGVKFYCDVEYDVFRFMREHGKKMGFTISMFEYRDTIRTLWDTSQAHFLGEQLPEDSMARFVTNDDGSYNLCHFWLNFEIADLSFFQSAQYRRYFAQLDRTGGFYYERWGDAPVHTLAAAHLLGKNKLWWFGDFGYYHPPYLQCPQGKTYVEKKCSCNRDMDFTYTDLSCVDHFLAVALAPGRPAGLDR